jgi:lipoprotein-releasing system permease protein
VRYALGIGLRYLASKKTKTVSVITFIAISGVALGVAALLAVMSITAGFQEEFRDKVLGVNAHVLVMKYGDFEEYRDVVARARELPEVSGAGPFLIQPMMLANGERISGVLLKGIDPDLMPGVLDLPDQMVEGTLAGLRVAGAAPPLRPEERDRPAGGHEDLDAYLRAVERAYRAGETDTAPEAPPEREVPPEPESPPTLASPPSEVVLPPEPGRIVFPEVRVPTPAEAEAALAAETPTESDGSAPVDVDDRAVVPTDALPGVVVGRTLARELDLSVGDRVRIVSPLAGFSSSLFGSAPTGAPRSRELRVIGIFEAGFDEYDTELVYADLYEAQQFFDHGDAVDGVEIRLHDPEQAPAIARRIEQELGGGAYHTMDWEELNHNLFTALEIQKIMLSLVIASIVFVAAFNVIATLIMIVLERKREIAILKAMGSADTDILAIFLTQGVAIGFVGTVVGLVIGGGVCLYLDHIQFPLDPHVYLIDHLPVRLSGSELVSTVVIAVLICIIATLVPSWWAARMVPADGVRQE